MSVVIEEPKREFFPRIARHARGSKNRSRSNGDGVLGNGRETLEQSLDYLSRVAVVGSRETVVNCPFENWLRSLYRTPVGMSAPASSMPDSMRTSMDHALDHAPVSS
jgi:hypothetical protein